MKVQQRLVRHAADHAVEYRVRLGAVQSQGGGKVELVLTEDAALDGAWVADQLVVGVRLPSFAGESPPALVGRHGRVGAPVRIRKHGVCALVRRGGRGAGGRCRSSSLGLRRRSTSAADGQAHDTCEEC